MGFCPGRVSVQDGLCSGGSLSREVSVQGGLCPGRVSVQEISVQGGGGSLYSTETPSSLVNRMTHTVPQTDTPLVNRMTDVSKNITLPQTSYAGGKN